MHTSIFTIILFLVIKMNVNGQEYKIPYYQIPEVSEEYTAGAVTSRMIDGLGFRYYWATEGLNEKDLNYQPIDKARTTSETIHHVLELSEVILNATLNKPNIGERQPKLTFEEKRRKTLENLKQASDILRASEDVSQFKLVFGKRELPFWNVINGPITDAIWHVGQIVSFRRSSGNPFPKGVSVLRGTKK